MNSTLAIDFAPILSDGYLYGLCALSALLLVLSLFLYKSGVLARTICTGAFILLLFNPSIVSELREAVPDVAVIVADHSPSQSFGNRKERTDSALSYLQQKTARLSDLEVRTVTSAEGLQQDTRLFEELDHILSDVPLSRRAGVIMITDGQVHDTPQDKQHLTDYGPISALITADKNERDRQLVVLEAPSYGIVGQDINIRYRIEDSNPGTDDYATVLIRQDSDNRPQMKMVPVNTDQILQTTISHAGQNIIDIETPPTDGELTAANNRLPLIVNGVRDRLRVLLVSGQPHTGGRTWRDMLTSDPGVDLVHFTILREPNKLDATPQRELSLIAFPFQELFEIKLYDFDLIIFDRYRLNRILPNYYFGNIARYVKEGGALLEASGPDFATENSVYTTDLQQVLPAFPTGEIINQAFKPTLTDKGKRHPVTENLKWPGATPENPGWGSWLRQIAVTPLNGETLMNGAGTEPLLILDRVGEGRVAQLASDQIWLWSRGFEGGGPQAELLRRMAHWLMKEPELEENALDVTIEDNALLVRRRSLTDEPTHITITKPDGSIIEKDMSVSGPGQLSLHEQVDQLGVYIVDDGTQKRFALAGHINPPELRQILGTEDKLAPAVSASTGTTIWLEKTTQPEIRLLPPDRRYGGKNWIGLRANRSYNVTGVQNTPFLPEWLYALTLLALIIGCWWLEGRGKSKL